MKWIAALLLAALPFIALPLVAMAGVEDDGEAVILLAKPDMPDPRFARTVVLVTFPQDTGPMGVVLNRPLDLQLGKLLSADRPELTDLADTLYSGGPVEPSGILFVFRAPEHPLRALPVIGDVYLSGDGKVFERLAGEGTDPKARRFYAGFAGWAEGQLDNEIAEDGWFVIPVTEEILFGMPVEGMWEALVKRAMGARAGR